MSFDKWVEKDEYWLLQTESSFCPICDENLSLLGNDGNGPSFYICFHCRKVRRVGVGLVKKDCREDIQKIVNDVRFNKKRSPKE